MELVCLVLVCLCADCSPQVDFRLIVCHTVICALFAVASGNAMAKSIKKKSQVKKISKTENKEKKIDSIVSKRVTRSSDSEILLEPKGKVQHKKKSEAQIVSRSAKSKFEVKQSRIVTRSVKLKFEEEKKTHFDPPRVTRSLHKSTKLSEVPNPIVQKENNRIEKRVNFIKLEKFKKDTICLAKQKFSIPWPARIINIEKDKILVHFFGDKRVGHVQLTEIYDFIKSSEAIQSIICGKRKPRGYITGLVEIELLLGIDSSQSIFNKI